MRWTNESKIPTVQFVCKALESRVQCTCKIRQIQIREQTSVGYNCTRGSNHLNDPECTLNESGKLLYMSFLQMGMKCRWMTSVFFFAIPFSFLTSLYFVVLFSVFLIIFVLFLFFATFRIIIVTFAFLINVIVFQI